MPKKKPPNRKYLPKGFDILHEDDDIIVINKPAGLLSVGTPTDKIKTAQYILTDYVRKGNPKSHKRIFVVHRLDQWTSGVLLFAKTEDVKFRLQDEWQNTEKMYVAVVHGQMDPKEGKISSYLAENKAFTVYSTSDRKKGKLSHTAYRTLKETPQFSLLEITLLTGRKNQIRVHLADRGHPIVGDRKYGRKYDPCKRLALHARSIAFTHPTTGQPMAFETKLPGEFDRLMKLGKKPIPVETEIEPAE
jgi:tRNA pseudouridine32 synthase/23S rRNA pseudouridine746 synthase/23S rRNA pseudouridine1911/1915/1917 synthase